MRPFARIALLGICLLAGAAPGWAATITIVNLDDPGEGFNDLTVVAPVGGNSGTTLGDQRLNVFQYAANMWGSILPDGVEIKVDARFDPIVSNPPCNATSGVLGSTGVSRFFRDVPGLPVAGTYYVQALANKLTGLDQDNSIDDMDMTFNSDVDNNTCLGTSNWYYGLDGNEGTNIELLPVVLHEMSHGLGFTAQVSPITGAFSPSDAPSLYSRFILDNSTTLHWNGMSNAQRVAAFTNTNNEVWDGPAVNAQVPVMMQHAPVVNVSQPALIAGQYQAGTAGFGPSVAQAPVTAQVVQVDDGVAPGSDACSSPLVNAAAVAGHIALIDRGTCTFTSKALVAQGAGAVGVIIVNNAAGGTPPDLGGTDPTVTIPVLSLTQSDGNIIRAQLGSGVIANLGLSPTLYAGADPSNRLRLFAPNPAQQGSSISHWDTPALPNLLMEPNISTSLYAQVDMTRHVFKDIGWFTGSTITGVEDGPKALPRLMNSPNPFDGATTVSFGLERSGPVELTVFGVDGRRVRRLVGWSLEAGPHSIAWDGKDDAGRSVPTGMYLFRIEAYGRSWTGRTIRLP
jgi:hypothetical protein